jgi:Tfp pilus assembly protein PilN
MATSTHHALPFCSRSWVGIDAGPDPAVAVARVLLGRLRLRTWRLQDAPPSLRRRVAQGVRCAAALPASAGLVVRLKPPDLPAAKRRRVLPSLLDLQLPFPADQCSCAFVDAPDDTVGLAVRNDDLRAALDVLAGRGTNPERIVPLAWVLWTQALREFPPDDANQRRVVLLALDNRLLAVAGAGAKFGSMVVVPTGSPDALRRSLQLAFGGASAGLSVLCAGPGAAELAHTMSQWPEPWRVAACPAQEPAFFLARALAVDALADRDGATQLRQSPFEHPRMTAAVPRAARAAVFAMLAGALLLLAASVVARRIVASQERLAVTALSQRLDAVAGYAVRTRGVRAVQEARDALSERLDPWVERLRVPGGSERLQRVLAAAKQAAVQVTHLSLAADGVTLSGRTASTASVAAFAAALGAAGLPVRVESDPTPAADGNVAFLVTPEVRP